MKKITLLLSALFIALSSVFAEAKLIVSPSEKTFDTRSYFSDAVDVSLTGDFDFTLDTAELTAPLQINVKGGLTGVTFTAEEVMASDPADPALINVSYTATKDGEWTDSIFVTSGELADTIVVSLKVEKKERPVITAPEKIEFGNIIFADAPKGTKLPLEASVTEGRMLKLSISGANFAASYNAESGKYDINFTASEAGDYTGTLTVKADDAVSKTVALSATVLKKPEIVVASTMDFGTLDWADAPAGKSLSIDATVDGGVTLSVELGGADEQQFEANLAENKLNVNFKVDPASAGEYSATATLSAPGADSKVVALSAIVNGKPVINVAGTSLEWEEVLLADAKAGVAREVAASVTQGVALEVEIGGTNASNFTGEIKDGKVVVTLTAQKTGIYKGTATLKVKGADSKEVSLFAYVKLPDPTITVNPGEWNVNLNLEAGKETSAEQQFVIIGKYLIDDLNISIMGKDSKFAWDGDAQKVTFSSKVAGTFRDTLMIASEGAETKKVALCAVVATPDPTLTVKPTAWKTVASLENGKATAERPISIRGMFLISDIEVSIKEANSPFAWDDEEQKVTFAANAVGIYTATLVVSAEGATTVEVPLEVEVKEGVTIPTISVGTTALAWGEVSLTEAQAGIVKETSATVNVGTLSVAIEGANKEAFTAVLAEGMLTITFKAALTGTYAASAVLSAAGAESKTVALSATVSESVVPPGPAGEWVSDPTALKAGDKIIITNKTGDVAMSIEQVNLESNIYRSVTAFDPDNMSKEVEVVELVASGSNFKLKVTGGYLYYDDEWNTAGKSGKKANWLGTNDTGSEFAFEANGDFITIKEVKNAGYILYNYNNGSNSRFAHYAKTTSVKDGETKLYKVNTPSVIPTTTISITPATASVEAGKTVTLTVSRDGNDPLTWSTSDASVATVANGVVTGVKEGTATITATANGKSATSTITVTGGGSGEIPEGTVAEFLANQGGKCYLTGVVSNIKNTLYGNFDLTDATGTIFVYGLLTADGEAKQFESLGVEEGDTLRVIAEEYKLYNETPEIVNAIFVWVKKAGAVIPEVDLSNIDFALATYKEEAAGAKWAIEAVQFDAEKTIYPKLDFVIKANSKTKLAGTYTIESASIHTSESEAIEYTGGSVTISCLEAETEESFAIYNFAISLKDANGKSVNYRLEVEVKGFDEKSGTLITFEDKSGGGSDIPTSTVAEFIAAQGGKCYLTGVVSNIKTNTDGSYNVYGNFDLTDASGTIYVYGILTPDGQKQQFQTMGVDEGDTLTIIAEKYQLYKETHEIVDAIFVSVKKASEKPIPSGDVLDVDYAEAAYMEDVEGFYWELFAAKSVPGSYDLDFPAIILYIDNTHRTHFAGTYDIFGGALYTSEKDSVLFTSGKAYIKCLETATETSYATYKVVAKVVDAAGKQHTYEFETEILAYDYSTDEEIVFEDAAGSEAIENTNAEIDFNAPIYNLQGMQVDRHASGILIQNGRKFIIAK